MSGYSFVSDDGVANGAVQHNLTAFANQVNRGREITGFNSLPEEF